MKHINMDITLPKTRPTDKKTMLKIIDKLNNRCDLLNEDTKRRNNVIIIIK